MAKDTLGVSENLAAEKVPSSDLKPGTRNPEPPASAHALTFDEAIEAAGNVRRPGLRVKGRAMPFGGSWTYDAAADELTLIEAPTAAS